MEQKILKIINKKIDKKDNSIKMNKIIEYITFVWSIFLPLFLIIFCKRFFQNNKYYNFIIYLCLINCIFLLLQNLNNFFRKKNG